jgi:hypothetical protein
MKIIQRSAMKIIPGKMEEAEELLRKDADVRVRLGMPPKHRFRLLCGRGDINYTCYFEQEWESLGQWEKFFKLSHDDEENKVLTEKWGSIMEKYTDHQFFTPWDY